MCNSRWPSSSTARPRTVDREDQMTGTARASSPGPGRGPDEQDEGRRSHYWSQADCYMAMSYLSPTIATRHYDFP